MLLTLDKSGHPFQSTVKNHLIYPPKTNYLYPSIPTRSIVPSFFCLNLLIGPDVLPITGLCLIISFDFQKLNVFAKVGFIFDFFVSESKSNCTQCLVHQPISQWVWSSSSFQVNFTSSLVTTSQLYIILFSPEFGKASWGMGYFWIKSPQEWDLCFLGILTPSTAPAGLPFLLLDQPTNPVRCSDHSLPAGLDQSLYVFWSDWSQLCF